MSIRDFTANVISASKVVPDGNFKDSKASGVWDINEALDLIKGGNWPNAANINPASFVDGVFQTHVYEGNNSTQTITNNINLSSKGGLVWIKKRLAADNNALFDTERGVNKILKSNETDASSQLNNSVTAFNSNGFSLGDNTTVNNGDGGIYSSFVSWTFRKQPKFFDMVTYTGDGNSGRTVSHSLGSVPGMIIVKKYAGSGGGEPWEVYHRGLDSTAPEDYRLVLNGNFERLDGSTRWNGTAPTSTEFTLGNESSVNGSGISYVAYLFAHNNDDGGFGEPGDQDIIKCGSYSGNGSTDGPEINLGFEPQFIVMKKHIGGTGNWFVADVMRGLIVGGSEEFLRWNGDNAESNVYGDIFAVTPTGFKLVTTSGTFNDSADEYIYMAIRRGGMQTPTAASDVFSIATRTDTDPDFSANHLVDMALSKDNVNTTGNWTIASRLNQGQRLYTNATDAEGASSYYSFDYASGWGLSANGADTNDYAWMWKRARGYFDVVCYTGTTTSPSFPPQTLNHNLGAVPEMMWIKCRSSGGSTTYPWTVYHKDIGNTKGLFLNTSATPSTGTAYWNNTTPTSTQFTVGGGYGVNESGEDYIAYLFATVTGVSKVGSFTGTAATQTIDCGFSSGARFVLIKEYNTTGGWMVFDTERGIVSGNDARLELDDTGAESTSFDILDPHSSGFQLPSSSFVNASGRECIFYAIA